MKIGKAIKLLLDQRKMTQKELAEKIGKSETSLSQIMQDKAQPRRDTLDSIAAALNVNTKMLLMLSVDKEDLPENKRDHYDILTKIINHIFLENEPDVK
jgi:transcriptional regulator with XRE-family HTH domain